MLRIVGGSLRGRRLLVPPATVRPTAERVREAIFNILGQRFDGERVLDLFAGSGALGLEALSRGAGSVTFVERDPRVAVVLRRNVESLGCRGACRIRLESAQAFVQKSQLNQYDIVFADPPYQAVPGVELWQQVVQQLIAPQGWLVIESAARAPVDLSGLSLLLDVRRYGDTSVHFARSA